MKKILAMLLAMIMAFSMSATAFAAEVSEPVIKEAPVTEETVTPRIYWNGTAILNTTNYENITSSNNIFKDSPVVTSNANNASYVYIRVIDGDGAQIGSTKIVWPGKSVTLDAIPAFSGTYTIQGKAGVSGTYTFNVD